MCFLIYTWKKIIWDRTVPIKVYFSVQHNINIVFFV